MVQRINDMRTARRELMSRLSSSGRKPSRRAHNPVYGELGTCALHADQALDRVCCGHLCPLQQQLTREQRAIEGALSEKRRLTGLTTDDQGHGQRN